MQIIVNLFYHSVLNHIHILLPTTLLWLCDNICLLLLFWHITWISALHISSLTTNTTIVRSCLYHCHAGYLFKDIRNTMPVQPIFCHYRDYLIDIEYWNQLYYNYCLPSYLVPIYKDYISIYLELTVILQSIRYTPSVILWQITRNAHNTRMHAQPN